MKRLSMIFGLCLVAATLHGQTLYFQTTGSDGNPCTISRPCFSLNASALQNGANTLVALDSVDFGAGGSITANRYFGAITIDGGPHGAFVTSDPTRALGLNLVNGTSMVLRNLTFVSTSGPALYLTMTGGSLTLENVTILSEADPGDGQGSITGSVSNGAAIHMKRVTILGAGAGIQISNASGAPFSFAAEDLTLDVTGAGLQLTDGHGVIRNSQFRSPVTTSTGLALLATSSTPTWLLDTCSFQNLAYGLVAGTGTVRISNSEFTGNGFGIFGGATAISYRNNVFAGNATDGAPIMSTSLK